MPEWIKAYNTAGVIKPEAEKLVRLTQISKPNFIVCSTLRRAIHSIEFIGYKVPDLTDDLYREAELPVLSIPIVKLKPEAWSVVFRLIWACGISLKVESLEFFKFRVTKAAKNLIELAKIHESVLFMGHGIFNRLLEKKLIANGWQKSMHSNKNSYWKYQHWEISIYTHP